MKILIFADLFQYGNAVFLIDQGAQLLPVHCLRHESEIEVAGLRFLQLQRKIVIHPGEQTAQLYIAFIDGLLKRMNLFVQLEDAVGILQNLRFLFQFLFKPVFRYGLSRLKNRNSSISVLLQCLYGIFQPTDLCVQGRNIRFIAVPLRDIFQFFRGNKVRLIVDLNRTEVHQPGDQSLFLCIEANDRHFFHVNY